MEMSGVTALHNFVDAPLLYVIYENSYGVAEEKKKRVIFKSGEG